MLYTYMIISFYRSKKFFIVLKKDIHVYMKICACMKKNIYVCIHKVYHILKLSINDIN
jgi:hypothetical protein